MYGGQFISELNVYGDLHLTDAELSAKVAEAVKNGGQVNNIKGNGMAEPKEQLTPDAEKIYVACVAALALTDDSGMRVFTKVHYWQSIYRVLNDMMVVNRYAEFTKLIQHLFPVGGMPKGSERLYLKHYSSFSTYDIGQYAKPFAEWQRVNEVSLKVDPRYLIAEKFRTELSEMLKC